LTIPSLEIVRRCGEEVYETPLGIRCTVRTDLIQYHSSSPIVIMLQMYAMLQV
jgi:hypothetical protein